MYFLLCYGGRCHCFSRRLVMRKWDVKTALGPFLQLGNKHNSRGLADLTVPKAAESLRFCSDGCWRWTACAIVGYDSSCGMYRAVSIENAQEIWGSQNLSGFSMQQEGTSLLTDSDLNPESMGVSLDSTPSWRSKGALSSTGGGSMNFDDLEVPTRLVARLNIRVPEEIGASRSIVDDESDWQPTQPSSSKELQSPRVHEAEDLSREPSFKALRVHCRLKPEDIPAYCSTQGSVNQGQCFNVPSYCSTQGSLRQGHLTSESSGYILKQIMKPLHGVESRLGIGMNGGTSERSLSSRRLTASGKSGAFMLPGEFNTSVSVVSENLLSWRKKDRPESAKCIVYDVFPLLSEIAREFDHVASLMDITSLPKPE